MPSRNTQLRTLEHEVCSSGCQELLERLQEHEPSLVGFTSWPEAAAFLARGSNKDAGKGEVLRPILEARDADSRWSVVLLFLFWHRLAWVHRLKRRLDEDPDELWANVTWVFTRAICRLDIDRRPDRLIDKVVNDVAKGLSREYGRSRRRSKLEEATDPQDPEGHIARDQRPTSDPEKDCRAAENRLRRHLDAGRLSETDFFLLCGTCIYGRPLADCARELSLTQEAAKKRRQRALKAIRPYEVRD